MAGGDGDDGDCAERSDDGRCLVTFSRWEGWAGLPREKA
jgi:hypothetical protein